MGAEPGEFEILPKGQSVEVGDEAVLEELDLAEIRFDSMQIVRRPRWVSPDQDVTVELLVDGERISRGGAPGLYGLMWVPMRELS